jgi:hypothetical protein
MKFTFTPASGMRFAFRSLLTLFLVAGMLFVAGCDGDDNGMTDPPMDDPEPELPGRFEAGPVDAEETNTEVDYDEDGTPEVIRVTDVDNGGVVPPDQGNKVTWTSDNIYELNGFVFVNPGDTLEIEAGTQIQGRLGGGAEASALIVASGGTIIAEGTPDDPIIFTSVETARSELGRNDRGLWGGVILLGDAPTNNGGQTQIEGVPDNTGGRILYGGANVDHNVGTFKYVSIRHTGTQLGNGDEIQGLTLGAVGSGSTIEYVESYASDDDGFEWFGGTVNTKYLITAYETDDAFDIDQGYRGSNQFWLAVQGGNEAGRASEMDGAGSPEDARPLAASIVSNATYIGMGPGLGDDAVSGDANDPFIIHRDNNATSYHNSVFTGGRTDSGIQIEDLEAGSDDSANRWEQGDLEHQNNVWFNIGPSFDGSSTTFEELIQLTTDDDGNPSGDRGEAFRGALADYLRAENNLILSSSPYSITRENGDGAIQSFTPSPQGDDVTSGAVEPSDFGTQSAGVNDDWTQVSFKGAFGPGAEWNLDTDWAKITQDGTIQ